jgi:hypothetical protein
MSTPLDGPVVPDVYMIVHTSDGSGSSTAWAGAAAWTSSSQAQTATWPSPGGASGGAAPTTTRCSMPTADASTWSNSARSSASTTTTRGALLRTWCSRKAPFSSVFTGVGEDPVARLDPQSRPRRGARLRPHADRRAEGEWDWSTFNGTGRSSSSP